MAKKKSKEDEQRKQPLQAVLLAEDWHSSSWGWKPLTLDRPKVLSPLLNKTMIDYVMEYLSRQGVQELFVVCVTQAVEDYVSLNAKHMKIVIVRDATIMNAGDAMRELDKRNVIESDPFVLVYGDVLTNCDLKDAIRSHKKRHENDSSAILTMLLTNKLTAACSSSTTEELLIGMDPNQDNRILLFDNNIEKGSAVIPCSFFANHCTSLNVRNDLFDVGLDLCSPEILARFSDEFDYRDIRSQFVANSVAEEEEGLQNKLFAHVLAENAYAARCTDIRSYHQTATDLLKRNAYPIVPGSSSNYTLQRHYLYYETEGKTRVGRSSQLSGPGMIGENCIIGNDCTIRASVLGDHCLIANKCKVQESHLWEGVELEEGAIVKQSVLAAGVVVKAGAVIPRGCVIGAGCVVGENVKLPEFTRLTNAIDVQDDYDDDWDDDEGDGFDDVAKDEPIKAPDITDTKVVGPDGKGRIWRPPHDDDEDDQVIPIEEILNSQCIGYDTSALLAKRLELQAEDPDDGLSLEEEDEFGDFVDEMDAGFTFSAESPIIGRQEGVDVIKELKQICLEFESSSPIENLAIELNSYKFSQNASYADCTKAATLAILEKMNITKSTTDGKLVADFKTFLEQWAPLLQKMSIGIEEEKAIVLALEESAVSDENGDMKKILSSGMSFRLLLQTLHDEEICSEEAILSWAAERQDADGLRGELFKLKPVQDFLEWLEEENDDSEDDDEED